MERRAEEERKRRETAMKKAEIQAQLAKSTGSDFPNISQIARSLGCRRETVVKMMEGISCLENGRSKKYFVGDIAERIMQYRN